MRTLLISAGAISGPSLSVYAQNARLRKRVRRLRELLDESLAANQVLRSERDWLKGGVILK